MRTIHVWKLGKHISYFIERNTLKTLAVLKELKLAPADDIEKLSQSYIFLRRIENRLQIEEERQLHTLPKDPKEIAALARRSGYADTERFLKELEEKTTFVAGCFEKLAG